VGGGVFFREYYAGRRRFRREIKREGTSRENMEGEKKIIPFGGVVGGW